MVKKEFEVYSYEEAVAAVEAEGYKVIRNKTNSWKTAGSPVGDAALKTFANAQMDKEKLTNVPGVGFIVVVAQRTHVSVRTLMRMLLPMVVRRLKEPMRFVELTMVNS